MSDKEFVNIPIELISDTKGYFDRQCPNIECEYIFKINMEDWKEKVSDEEVHCPLCGHIDSSDKWFTENQLEEIEKIALSWATNFIQKELDSTFKKLERSTRNNKFLKIEYKPSRKLSFINNPIGQLLEWESDITCNECGTRYSVIGAAYFCPCCGYYAIEDIFNETLDSITKMLDSIEEIRKLFEQQFGTDKAETMSRSLIEGSLGDVVSAFQKFAEANYTTYSSIKVRPNDFQIVQKGSNLYREQFGNGYEEWLNRNEIELMELMFQRRHIIEHNSGLIDERYLEKTKDSSYEIGQRLIVKKSDIKKLIEVIRKLGEGIRIITRMEVM